MNSDVVLVQFTLLDKSGVRIDVEKGLSGRTPGVEYRHVSALRSPFVETWNGEVPFIPYSGSGRMFKRRACSKAVSQL